MFDIAVFFQNFSFVVVKDIVLTTIISLDILTTQDKRINIIYLPLIVTSNTHVKWLQELLLLTKLFTFVLRINTIVINILIIKNY